MFVPCCSKSLRLSASLIKKDTLTNVMICVFDVYVVKSMPWVFSGISDPTTSGSVNNCADLHRQLVHEPEHGQPRGPDEDT